MTELAPLGAEDFSLERLRVQEQGACADRRSADAPAAPPPASSEASGEPSTSISPEKQLNDFIYHKVTKLDTLAGLAIKYRVTVSDIKRANGILSDNAMFAREHVKIPTGSMPMSEEAQVLLARLMSGYGRDASLNARERKAPGSVSITQLPGSPTSRSSNYCSSEAVDDDPGTPYSRRSDKSSSEPGDVELMERSGGDGAGPHSGYGSDRVRRRTKNDSSSSSTGSRYMHSHISSQQLGQAAEAAVGWLSHAAAGAAAAAQAALPAAASSLSTACLPPVARRSFNNTAFGGGGGAGGDSSTWDQLACAITQGGSSLITKIKRAASQPALAGPQQQPGLGDVADALLMGGSHNGGGSNATISGSGASSRRCDAGGGGGSGIDLLARGTGLLPPRKDTKGD